MEFRPYQLIVNQPVRRIPVVNETESALPCSQKFLASPCRQLMQYISHLCIIFLKDQF
jgi:hypothetical protein